MRASSVAALYATLLLGGAGVFAAPEALQRPARGMGRRDISRAIRVDLEKYDAAALRLAQGVPRPNDDDEQTRVGAHLHVLLREGWLRDAQTLALLVVALGSAGMVVLVGPAVVRLQRGAPPRGIVEIVAEEKRVIAPEALGAELSRLSATRSEAVERIRSVPRVRCAYCGRPSRWIVLGRVGKRVLMKQPPDGAKDLAIRLGEGWWHVGMPPAPCRRCGSKDIVEG